MSAAYEAYLGEVLIDADTIQRRVAELARQISDDYRDQTPLLVCILKGGIVFLVDLVKHIDVPHAIDFMAVSSYGPGARESSGAVRIIMDLEQDIEGRHVLIVEDIIDSGRTLHYISNLLLARNPASLRICALLDKRERREVDVPLDYVGFDIPNKYVFGYGLDLDELFRNLPFVGVLKDERMSGSDLP
jgi:hypoxanthine phosphoribosyltransferase